jgi:hypothetical protein
LWAEFASIWQVLQAEKRLLPCCLLLFATDLIHEKV